MFLKGVTNEDSTRTSKNRSFLHAEFYQQNVRLLTLVCGFEDFKTGVLNAVNSYNEKNCAHVPASVTENKS